MSTPERADREQRDRCRSRPAAGRAPPARRRGARRRASRRRPRRRSAGCRCPSAAIARVPERAPAADHEQRGQQREHRDHRDGDAERADRPEPRGALDLRDRQAQQRADHRRARRRRSPGRPCAARAPSPRACPRACAAPRGSATRAAARSRCPRRARGSRGSTDDCPLTRDAELGQPVADRARGDLGEDDREQRDPEEDRAAVDQDQQHDDEQQRGAEQRPVDVLEDLDRVGREAGPAGHLDLEPAARVADAVADVVDRVEDRVALAVAGDAADQQRGVAGLGRARLAERRDGAVDAALVLLDRRVELRRGRPRSARGPRRVSPPSRR